MRVKHAADVADADGRVGNLLHLSLASQTGRDRGHGEGAGRDVRVAHHDGGRARLHFSGVGGKVHRGQGRGGRDVDHGDIVALRDARESRRDPQAGLREGHVQVVMASLDRAGRAAGFGNANLCQVDHLRGFESRPRRHPVGRGRYQLLPAHPYVVSAAASQHGDQSRGGLRAPRREVLLPRSRDVPARENEALGTGHEARPRTARSDGIVAPGLVAGEQRGLDAVVRETYVERHDLPRRYPREAIVLAVHGVVHVPVIELAARIDVEELPAHFDQDDGLTVLRRNSRLARAETVFGDGAANRLPSSQVEVGADADNQQSHDGQGDPGRRFLGLGSRMSDHPLDGGLADRLARRPRRLRRRRRCNGRSAGTNPRRRRHRRRGTGATRVVNDTRLRRYRARLHLELELRSGGAELHGIAVRDPGGAIDAMLVEKGAVAAVEVGQQELVGVRFVAGDARVLAPHQVVLFGMVFDRRPGVAPDQQLGEVLEGKLLDFVGFRAG